MAVHPLEPDTAAIITDEPPTSGEPLVQLKGLLQTVVRKINGLLSFGTGRHGSQAGNIHGQWMWHTAPALAGLAFAVPHGLGRVPTAVIPVVAPGTSGPTPAVDFELMTECEYDKICTVPIPGTTVQVYPDPAQAWTEELVWLKCNVASARLLLLIV